MSNHSHTPEEQFIIYHKRLRSDLDTAHAHYEIAKSLRDFSQTRRSEFSEAQSFFELTLIANFFVTAMIINRFIDKRKDCLRLNSFFKLIRKNVGLGLFSTSAFSRRLADEGMSKKDVEGKVESHIEITAEMVDEDERILKSLPTEHLKLLRDNVLAHTNEALLLNNTDIINTYPVTVNEIDDILRTLDEILNRYIIAYDGRGYDIRFPVRQQMERVMDAIKFYRPSRKERK